MVGDRIGKICVATFLNDVWQPVEREQFYVFQDQVLRIDDIPAILPDIRAVFEKSRVGKIVSTAKGLYVHSAPGENIRIWTRDMIARSYAEVTDCVVVTCKNSEFAGAIGLRVAKLKSN